MQEDESSHRWPQFLPDGETVIFAVNLAGRGPDDWAIAVQQPRSSEHRVLIQGGTYPAYVPTGHLVYFRAGTIMAVPFDPVRLEVTGMPAPALDDVMLSFGVTGAGQFSFSNSGSLAYVPGAGNLLGVAQTLVWVDRSGAAQPLGAPQRAYENPRLSPDGRRLAVRITEANIDLWVYELERRTLSRLTFDDGEDETPVWSPDGRWVTFAGDREGTRRLLRKPADGSGEEEELATLQEHVHATSLTPDGKVLAFETGTGGEIGDVWLVPTEGDRTPTALLSTPFNERGARFSPDGRWLAYASDETGRNEIYVQPFPGPGRKWQISPEGGEEPVWARNGRELFLPQRRTG